MNKRTGKKESAMIWGVAEGDKGDAIGRWEPYNKSKEGDW